ncbi:MAG: hypothetical protein LBM25_05345 [Bacteroidales bacterium]|jgi:hypothetical protein|nr:hypothetical protein [Bacteroidales bacterium]
MRKILLFLGVFTALCFTSCELESDCECIMGKDLRVYIRDFRGDCNAISWDDIPVYQDDYDYYDYDRGIVGTLSLNCTYR